MHKTRPGKAITLELSPDPQPESTTKFCFPLPSSEDPEALLLPSWSGYSQVRALGSVPTLWSVAGLVLLSWKTLGLLVQKQGSTWRTQGETGYPQLAVAMYGVLLGPFLEWHEPASDRC